MKIFEILCAMSPVSGLRRFRLLYAIQLILIIVGLAILMKYTTKMKEVKEDKERIYLSLKPLMKFPSNPKRLQTLSISLETIEPEVRNMQKPETEHAREKSQETPARQRVKDRVSDLRRTMSVNVEDDRHASTPPESGENTSTSPETDRIDLDSAQETSQLPKIETVAVANAVEGDIEDATETTEVLLTVEVQEQQQEEQLSASEDKDADSRSPEEELNSPEDLSTPLIVPVETTTTYLEPDKTKCGDKDQYTRPLEIPTYRVNEMEKTFLAIPSEARNMSAARFRWMKVRPASSNAQRETMKILLEEFLKVTELYKIKNYFIFSGSLLGSYRHHGIQPWDDDIDILMRFAEQEHIFASFRQYVNKSKNFSMAIYNQRLKFFHKTRSTPIKNIFSEYSWPFLDISFYYDNETHIWELWHTKNELYNIVHKSLIFPLHLRPYQGVWINSPRDAFAVLKKLYRDSTCIALTWIHRLEAVPVGDYLRFDCNITAPIYPFVHRKVSGSCVEESLEIDGTVLYTVLIDEPVYAISEPYVLKLV